MSRKHLASSAALSAVACLFVCSCGPRPDAAPDAGPARADTTFISIGTGSVTGVYYQVGAAIMALVNRGQAAHGIKASFRATGGSVYNINAVLNGDLDFGICQSDRQFQAIKGLAEWKEGGPRSELRAICSVHPEAVTLVAAEDSGIRTLADLKGKRVNIGNIGSGSRRNAMDVLAAIGLDWKRDVKAEEVKASESSTLLQDGRIDAFFFTVGHPNGAIEEATAGRRAVRFVPITGMDGLRKKSPYYSEAIVPVALYAKVKNSEDVPTVGVMTTLVTSAAVSEHVVYSLTKAVFDGLTEFKGMHDAFAGLEANTMVSAGLSAPLHRGAEKYFAEKGLLPAK